MKTLIKNSQIQINLKLKFLQMNYMEIPVVLLVEIIMLLQLANVEEFIV